MIKNLLLLTIFLTPLGMNSEEGYEYTKIVLFILSISLICFLWLFSKPKVSWSYIKVISLIFIFVLFITSILGLNPGSSLVGRSPYFQGWIVYLYLFIFSLLVSTIPIKFKDYAATLVSSSIVVSAVAAIDWVSLNILGWEVANYAGRVVSTFGQPNFFAGFLLLTLPFAYYLVKQENQKLSYLGKTSGVVSILGIFASHSRAAIFLFSALVFLYLILKLSKTRRWLVFISLFLIFCGSMQTSFYFKSGFIYKEFLEPSFIAGHVTDPVLNSVEKRVYIWPVLINLGLQNPYLGYGLENIGLVYSNYFVEKKHILFEETPVVSDVLIRLKDLNVDRTHNYILDLTIFSGIGGVFVWILLSTFLLKKILSKNISLENNVLLLGLITYLTWIQFQNQSIVHLIYFWFIVGLTDLKLD